MQTDDLMRSVEWQVLESYGYERTGNRHIDCPLCRSKRSLRFHELGGRARWICKCDNGNVMSFIMALTGQDFKSLADQIDSRYGNQYEAPQKPKLRPVNQQLEPIKGTFVEEYLRGRGINILPRMGVSLARSQRYWCDETETSHYYDAMVGTALNHALDPAYMHRTYFKSGAKFDRKIETVKQSDNVAIRMFNADRCMGIGEGIESCLSATQLYKVPTWSVMNTAYMKKFRAPLGVQVLVIYADNDSHGAGLAAAFVCGNANVLCKNDVMRVVIKWPENGDFNDHLLNPGKVYEWELTR